MPRVCSVPECQNKISRKHPVVILAEVPQNPQVRKKWLQAMGREDTKGRIYVCQDHFDLPNDMINYTQYCINGYVHNMVIKYGVLPSRFDCQKNKKDKSKEVNIKLNSPKKVIKKRPTRVKFISHRGTQTTEDLLDYQYDTILKEELDPLAITYPDNCWSSTYDTQTVIREEIYVKEENINTEEEEDYSNKTVIKEENIKTEEEDYSYFEVIRSHEEKL